MPAESITRLETVTRAKLERDVLGTAIIGIEWAAKAPLTIPKEARASARPFQPPGNRITPYLDRLTDILMNGPSAAAIILGHVLTHEIAHVEWPNNQAAR